MTANTLVQTRIDPVVKKQASTVLEDLGLTVSEAMRILLTRIAKEGRFPLELSLDPEAHDAWFRAKVKDALEDTRPLIPHTEVEARFARRRETMLREMKEANKE